MATFQEIAHTNPNNCEKPRLCYQMWRILTQYGLLPNSLHTNIVIYEVKKNVQNSIPVNIVQNRFRSVFNKIFVLKLLSSQTRERYLFESVEQCYNVSILHCHPKQEIETTICTYNDLTNF